MSLTKLHKFADKFNNLSHDRAIEIINRLLKSNNPNWAIVLYSVAKRHGNEIVALKQHHNKYEFRGFIFELMLDSPLSVNIYSLNTKKQ